MKTFTKIGILGAGAWGTALAAVQANDGKDNVIIARDEKIMQEINDKKTNEKYLGKAKLPKTINATDNWKELKNCEIVLAVVPAQQFKNVVEEIKNNMNTNATLVLCAKGIDKEKNMFLSEIAKEHFNAEQIAVLSGPSFAKDVVEKLPCAVSLAAHTMEIAQAIAHKLATARFRIYANDDVRGVEAAGALKNVFAIGAGIAKGMELGQSSQAALITRSFAEMKKIIMAFEGKQNTADGLAGMGDLILTAASEKSRNFSYGVNVAYGKYEENKLVEGIHTAEIAQQKAKENNIDTPILNTICQIIQKDIKPKDAVQQLLNRPLAKES